MFENKTRIQNLKAICHFYRAGHVELMANKRSPITIPRNPQMNNTLRSSVWFLKYLKNGTHVSIGWRLLWLFRSFLLRLNLELKDKDFFTLGVLIFFWVGQRAKRHNCTDLHSFTIWNIGKKNAWPSFERWTILNFTEVRAGVSLLALETYF